jgi:16S rRNA (guanine(966)-N(2))-methyltransferase RsmD
MRVVAGSAKGRPLHLVPGHTTRPIMDRVKTAVFDILRPRIAGMRVLDLFAGSGSVGIEALSQGALYCTFIDSGKSAIATIKKNLANTGLSDHAQVVHADAFAYLKATAGTFDLIYVAPPQYKGLWSRAMREIAARPELLPQGSEGTDDEQDPGLIVVQIHPKEYEDLDLGEIRETRQKRYGNTLLVFFERVGAE